MRTVLAARSLPLHRGCEAVTGGIARRMPVPPAVARSLVWFGHLWFRGDCWPRPTSSALDAFPIFVLRKTPTSRPRLNWSFGYRGESWMITHILRATESISVDPSGDGYFVADTPSPTNRPVHRYSAITRQGRYPASCKLSHSLCFCSSGRYWTDIGAQERDDRWARIQFRWVAADKNGQELDAIAKQHGCLDPPLLENQRPLGVDRLEQIFRASAESRLMELFLFHFRQTGNTLKQVFLMTPAYGTVDPANIGAILSTKFEGEWGRGCDREWMSTYWVLWPDWSFGPRREITFPMFGDGIFTQEGEAWKHSRLMLRPQLAHRQYEDLKLFDEPMDDLLDSLPQSGGVVDLQPLFFRFTLDVTTAFLFGESIRSLKSDPGSPEQNFAAAFDLAQSYVIQRFRLLDLYWLIGGRKFREACRQVNAFADKVIDQNLRGDTLSEDDDTETGRYVFLRTVAKSFPERAALRGQIVNILAAGRDTTACLLSWTLWVTWPTWFPVKLC